MKSNIKIPGLLFASLVLLSSSYYFIFISNCGNSIFCFNLETRMIALLYGSGALSLIFFILLFIPKAFQAWKRFAVWFVPFAALLFVFYPNPGAGDYFSPYPEQVFKWVSILYVLISLVIIVREKLKK